MEARDVAVVLVCALVLTPLVAPCDLSVSMVDDATGQPIVYGTVDLYRLTREGLWQQVAHQFVEDAGGRSVFEGLEPGTYTVLAHDTTRHHPQWHGDVAGWRDPEAARPIVIDDSDVDIAFRLRPTPFDISLDPWEPRHLPAGGGRVSVRVRVVNVSGERRRLEAWIVVDNAPTRTNWADVPVVAPRRFWLPRGKGRSSSITLAFDVPPRAVDTWYYVQVYVGPADAAPWEATVSAAFDLCKGGK